MFTPEILLPVLKWTALLSFGGGVTAGVVVGLLEGMGVWPRRRKAK